MRLILSFMCLLAASSGFAQDGKDLRMNQIQVIGTHNSYHLRKSPTHPARQWDYAHLPLDQQLDAGVRSLELDLHYKADGWRVFHVPRLDDNSSCPLLSDCLQTVRRWSDAHPRHVPISFLCEIKEEGRPLDKTLLDFDAQAADRLDAEIRAAFDAKHLITPDDVRGDAPTLTEAVRRRGWPLLDASRGKVFFIVHDQGKDREVYVKDRPVLEGRAMFVRSSPDRADCAVMVEDFPNVEKIQNLVKEGYWIRTRADADPGEELTDGAGKRVASAMASGAQIVSTDHPPGESVSGGGKIVALPGGTAARPNPVNAPSDVGNVPLE